MAPDIDEWVRFSSEKKGAPCQVDRSRLERKMFTRAASFAILFFVGVQGMPAAPAPPACVWKVTSPQGHYLYLGGSMHSLRATDYPLPSAYNRAFDDSSALVLEEDINVSMKAAQKFYRSGFYENSDSLKNHLDPRTYDYLRRFFTLAHVPEAQWSKCKPWMLLDFVVSQGTNQLGVEYYLIARARANHKPVLGLESFREHAEIISGLSDKQAELAILLNFIPQGDSAELRTRMTLEWRRGDAEALARDEVRQMRDLPFFELRLIDQRNRDWVPKIESYLAHGRNYFVVAGAGHFGGPNGLLALLRARGNRIEQL
jgi:hypothetical protein